MQQLQLQTSCLLCLFPQLLCLCAAGEGARSGGSQLLLSGLLPHLLWALLSKERPSHICYWCVAGSVRLVALPLFFFFSCLKRLLFYWSTILHPRLKDIVTKCFWLPNLFSRGTNLSKSNLMVVLILTLWRSLITAVLLVCALPLEQCRMKPAACGASLTLSSQRGPECTLFSFIFSDCKRQWFITRSRGNNEEHKE